MLQKDLARLLGVHFKTLKNWERGVNEPVIGVLPKVIAFLGYDPVPEPHALHRRIAFARRRVGMTQEELAVAIAIDSVTLWRWEKGRTRPDINALEQFQALLGEEFVLVQRR